MARCHNATIDDNEQISSSQTLEEQRTINQTPFQNLRIANTAILDTIEGRRSCKSCHKSRKFFCYTCCIPVIDPSYFPRVKLPIKIDIIKHPREIDGKSTAIHAAILAPDDVTIYTYPDFPKGINKEECVLIFPSKYGNISVEKFLDEVRGKDGVLRKTDLQTEFPIKRAIFIDSTWAQTKSIYKDMRLRELPCIALKSRLSQFWRYHKNSPRSYLATIEAIHQFLIELHTHIFGVAKEYVELDSSMPNEEQKPLIEKVNESAEVDQRYNGQYDNLMYFFKYMYNKIHAIYGHDKLLAYQKSRECLF